MSRDPLRLLLLKWTHLLVVAATQAGKTVWANTRHRKFRKRSVFVDTKGIDPIWGTKVRTLRPFAQVMLKDKKLVYDPPRLVSGIDWVNARADLETFWAKVQAMAKASNQTPERTPWIQIVIDEAQVWLDECGDIIEDMTARGLGMGLVVVLITQYPAGLNGKLGTRIRNNLETRIVLRQGDEGRRCIQSWQWPVDPLTRWTEEKYHFASYYPGIGWRLHCPIDVGRGPCNVHPQGPPAFTDYQLALRVEKRAREQAVAGLAPARRNVEDDGSAPPTSP